MDKQLKIKYWMGLTVGVAAICAAMCSLSWRMVHDTSILMCLANLMVHHGAVPYRDFFDMNLPGTYGLFCLIVQTLGTSDLAVHVANLLIITLISLFMFWTFPRSCRWCAVFGIGLGALRIFSGEWVFVLQREEFALIPISALLVLGLRQPFRIDAFQGIFSGLLMSWLVLIKPQFVLYGLPAIYLMWVACESWSQRIRAFAVMVGAFLVPILICILWIVQTGAWEGFLDVVHYWPLYGQMTFDFQFVDPAVRMNDLFVRMSKMVVSPYTAVAVLGLFVGLRSGVLARREANIWAGMLVLAIIVPALTGQFWPYHRLPFYYFALCMTGYLLAGQKWAIGLGVAIMMVWIPFAGSRVWRETSISSVASQKHEVPDLFASYLKIHLQPGDRVQPIDWAWGALQGILTADAVLATRFPYTFYFHHHVHHPLIQKLRAEFLDDLEKLPPRFLLEATKVAMPTGRDTEIRFDAFESWKERNYRIVDAGPYHRIWEWKRTSHEQ
jgi:hypothetical protein